MNPKDYILEHRAPGHFRVWLGIQDHECTDVDFERMTLSQRDQTGADDDPDEWSAETHTLRRSGTSWEVLLSADQRRREIVHLEDALRSIEALPVANDLTARQAEELETRLAEIRASNGWVPVLPALCVPLDEAWAQWSA